MARHGDARTLKIRKEGLEPVICILRKWPVKPGTWLVSHKTRLRRRWAGPEPVGPSAAITTVIAGDGLGGSGRGLGVVQRLKRGAKRCPIRF